jgi:hypothetical protein
MVKLEVAVQLTFPVLPSNVILSRLIRGLSS